MLKSFESKLEVSQDPSERHSGGLIFEKILLAQGLERGLRSPSHSQPEGDYLAALRSFWTHFYFERSKN